VNTAKVLVAARARSGLTQVEVARRAGTSQATLSAYENGAKTPSIGVLQRLLGATGQVLKVADMPGEIAITRKRQAVTARRLADVIALAEVLPISHEPELRYPRLPVTGK